MVRSTEMVTGLTLLVRVTGGGLGADGCRDQEKWDEKGMSRQRRSVSRSRHPFLERRCMTCEAHPDGPPLLDGARIAASAEISRSDEVS